MREGSGYKNLEREGPSREAGGGQTPTSSSALGCGPARNPGVLAPSVLLVLLGIRKSALNIKQPVPPLQKERRAHRKTDLQSPLFGAHPSRPIKSTRGLQVENSSTSWTNGLLLGSQTPVWEHAWLSTSLLSRRMTHLFMDFDNSGWHQEQLMKSHAPKNQFSCRKKEESSPGNGREWGQDGKPWF